MPLVAVSFNFFPGSEFLNDLDGMDRQLLVISLCMYVLIRSLGGRFCSSRSRDG